MTQKESFNFQLDRMHATYSKNLSKNKVIRTIVSLGKTIFLKFTRFPFYSCLCKHHSHSMPHNFVCNQDMFHYSTMLFPLSQLVKSTNSHTYKTTQIENTTQAITLYPSLQHSSPSTHHPLQRRHHLLTTLLLP